MRAYIANKMTGVPQSNIPWFDAAAADLRARGIDAISPAELDDPETREAALADEPAPNGQTWGDFLARDLKLIADDGIEAIIVGPDWQDSKGARLETFVAYALMDLPVLEYPHLNPVSVDTLMGAWVGHLLTARLT